MQVSQRFFHQVSILILVSSLIAICFSQSMLGSTLVLNISVGLQGMTGGMTGGMMTGGAGIPTEPILTSAPPPVADEFAVFPLEPPSPTRMYKLDPVLEIATSESTLLRDVEAKLRRAIVNVYGEDPRYYAVRDGFAVATAIDGITRNNPARIRSVQAPEGSFLSVRFLQRITGFFRDESEDISYFRVIIFVVTPHAIEPNSKVLPTPAEKKAWIDNLLDEGASEIPPETLALEYTEDYETTVLIYEFSEEPNPAVVRPHFSPREHLEGSGLWAALTSSFP